MKKHELSDASKAAKKAAKAEEYKGGQGRGEKVPKVAKPKATTTSAYRGGMGRGEPTAKPKPKSALTTGNLDVGKKESGVHTGSLSPKEMRTGTLALDALKVGDTITDKNGKQWTVTKRTN